MAIPDPPVMDAETADQMRALMAKGFAGTVFLVTDDCRASYEELSGRGVEFVETPEERPYGIDSAFRDPSGNNLRLTQVTQPAAAWPSAAVARGDLSRGAPVGSILVTSPPRDDRAQLHCCRR